MVIVVYNEALDMEVMEVLERCGSKNYTKIIGAFGKGETSGIHLGSDIWPGRNNILSIVSDEKQARQIISCVKELRRTLGLEGVKAFILPVEEMT